MWLELGSEIATGFLQPWKPSTCSFGLCERHGLFFPQFYTHSLPVSCSTKAVSSWLRVFKCFPKTLNQDLVHSETASSSPRCRGSSYVCWSAGALFATWLPLSGSETTSNTSGPLYNFPQAFQSTRSQALQRAATGRPQSGFHLVATHKNPQQQCGC